MPISWGVSVWLEIDGKRLDEFGLQHNEEANTVTCWVPCQTGKEFRFGVSMIQAAPRPLHYRIGLCLDGRVISSPSALPNRSIRKTSECSALNPRYFDGQQEDRGLRPFQFASIKLTDDESRMTDVSKLGDLVAIISVYEDLKTKNIPKKDRKAPQATVPISMGDAVVHETAKKGLTSCIQFGELRGNPRSSTAGTSKKKAKTTKAYAVGLKELGRIIFKYRQMDILIADGIAPRPASAPRQTLRQEASSSKAFHKAVTSRPPVPSTQSVKQETVDLSLDDEDDDEQLEQLKARLAHLREVDNLEARIKALESKKRPHNGEGSSKAPKRAKKEEAKAGSFIPGEIIDLT